MKKILYFYNETFTGGGIQSVIFNYFSEIDKDNYHIDFVVHGKKPQVETNPNHLYLINSGSEVFYVPKRSEGFTKNKRAITDILSNHHYDIVHTHMDTAGYYPLKIAKKLGIPCRIAHSHNTKFVLTDRNPVKKILHFLISEYCRHLICSVANVRIAVSKDAGKWLFRHRKFQILPNAIDTKKFMFNSRVRSEIRRKFDLHEMDKAIINVARFDKQKNQMFMIQLMSLMKNQKHIHLFLVGEGPDFLKVKNKISTMHLEDKISLLGSRSDVYKLLQGMDLFILPSNFEGLPVSLVEAQASGLKCIVSEAVSKEASINNEIEFLPLNTNVWMNSILNFKIRTNDFRVLCSNKVAHSKFDIKQQVFNLENIYSRGEQI
jgi:glycosyltransferase involved in cell wall biosynthesis